MAVGAPIYAAVIAAGTTAYTVESQKEAANKAARNADELAARSEAEARRIESPTTASTAQSMLKQQQLAASAGGTLTGTPNQQVGDALNQPRKTLLGS